MQLFQIFLICSILAPSWFSAQHKRFYSSPFLTPTWEHKIVRESYSYNNVLGGPSEYLYNKDGILYQKEFIRSDGYKTITTFQYLLNGHLRTSVRVLPDGRKMIFSYVYDNRDHLIGRVSSIGDSVTSRESYVYTTRGLLLNAVYSNVDGWLTGNLKFTHDRGNRLTKGTYTGENGLNAEIFFTCDLKGLVVEIKWIFSNETFQQYFFEYD